ncbi:MAG: hypothetical protein Ct9H90mP16_10010 [Candidatus Poseidoniales archaeon]|nr:MAG: hypothetical protein Ct9H90mP16_10010 [Candidatus Poseidoniales archaeon]
MESGYIARLGISWVAVDADHCNCWALFALLCDNIAPATHLLTTGMGLPYALPWLVNHQHLLCHWNRIRNLRSLGKWARIPWLVLTLGTGSSLHSPLMGPRWRILCRLEEGLDPFEGHLPEPETEVQMDETDTDMEVVIDSIEEDPPVLYQSDSEE